MKKHIINIGLFGLCLLGFANVQAQGKLQMNINYNTGMPIGSFKDAMGKNSFRGYTGEISYPVSNSLRIGLGVGYNDYYEKIPRQVYSTKDGEISAVVSNSIQTTPIVIKANYTLTKEGLVRPYVGIGAGGNMISYRQYFGEFPNSKSVFKPMAMADAGVNIPFNRETRNSGINIGANFNYMPFNYNGVDNLNNWGVHAGFFFPLR